MTTKVLTAHVPLPLPSLAAGALRWLLSAMAPTLMLLRGLLKKKNERAIVLFMAIMLFEEKLLIITNSYELVYDLVGAAEGCHLSPVWPRLSHGA